MLSVVAQHDGISESRFTEAGQKVLNLCYTKAWAHKTKLDNEWKIIDSHPFFISGTYPLLFIELC